MRGDPLSINMTDSDSSSFIPEMIFPIAEAVSINQKEKEVDDEDDRNDDDDISSFYNPSDIHIEAQTRNGGRNQSS